MGIYLNILVIIMAVIVFLIIYYITAKNDQKRKNYHLPLNELDMETGEELGVDYQNMYDKGVVGQPDKLRETESKEGDATSAEEYQLSDKYNEEFLRLFARDPEYLYAYWETNHNEFYQHKPILRLYQETESNYQDIELNHLARDWYIKCQPDRLYRVELGYEKEGLFHSIISSQQIKTPKNRPSDIIDEHWMTIEELSHFSYRIDVDSITMLKQLKARKLEEEVNADSYSLVNH